MSGEVISQGKQLQPVGLSTNPAEFLGLSDAERLRLLTQGPGVIPARHVRGDESTDPSGLLEQEDTYEVLAGLIFQECEGIYRQLVLSRPEVRQQFLRGRKNPKKLQTVKLPATQLTELYTFEMVRTADSASTQYVFHRTDEGYEDRGFMVRKQEGGHTVLKNIAPEKTDTDDDEKYFGLLHNAQKWVRDYAATLNIQPEILLNLAKKDIEPPSAAVRAGRIGRRVAGAGGNIALAGLGVGFVALESAAKGAKHLATVEEPVYSNRTDRGRVRRTVDHRRRPRLLAVAAAAALVPIPGHGLTGEIVAKDTWGVTTGAPGAVIGEVNKFLNGGDKTIEVGVACPEGEHPRVLDADMGWDGYVSVGCENAAGQDQAPPALNLPNIADDARVKPNFRLVARVNNYGEFFFTQEASVSHDLDSDTAQSQTIQFADTDAIKEVKIEKITPQ